MILLSLVGEQPIPNLLPLWQFHEITGVQFAATSTTERQAKALLTFLSRDDRLVHLAAHPTVLVEAYHLSKARQALARTISEWQARGEDLLLNFTGGTKIMSLAALQAAYGSGVSLLYVSTEEGAIIFYQSDGVETRREPLKVDIRVAQYLEASGLKVTPPGAHFVPSPKEGDWLEERVQQAAMESGLFDDVQRGVRVACTLRDGTIIHNELDVVVTRNGKLAVCSCKTGKNISNDTIYELAAISSRESLGIYCGKVLVATSNELPPGVAQRARASRVMFVDQARLDQVAYYLKLATD
jgi:hypothetical protein